MKGGRPTCSTYAKALEHSGVVRLQPSRDATTRTPARAWRDGVLCLRALRVYVATKLESFLMSSQPSCGEA